MFIQDLWGKQSVKQQRHWQAFWNSGEQTAHKSPLPSWAIASASACGEAAADMETPLPSQEQDCAALGYWSLFLCLGRMPFCSGSHVRWTMKTMGTCLRTTSSVGASLEASFNTSTCAICSCLPLHTDVHGRVCQDLCGSETITSEVQYSASLSCVFPLWTFTLLPHFLPYLTRSLASEKIIAVLSHIFTKWHHTSLKPVLQTLRLTSRRSSWKPALNSCLQTTQWLIQGICGAEVPNVHILSVHS